MIISFSVQNFGSIKDKQTLSFEASNATHLEEHYIIHINNLRLLKLGLIYGANASGKTTVLKALDFLNNLVLAPLEKKTEPLNFDPFLFDAHTPNQDSSLSIDFIQKGIWYSYEVVFNRNAIVSEALNFYNPNKASVFKRNTSLENQFTRIQFGSKVRTSKTFEKTLAANTLWNNTVFGGFLKTNMELNELKDGIDWFTTYLKAAIYTNTQLDHSVTKWIENKEIDKQSVLNILKGADLNISDIFYRDKDINEETLELFSFFKLPGDIIEKIKSSPLKDIIFEHTVNDASYSLPFDKESQGTQRFYGFAGLLSLLINKSVAVPIDELEASLHPDLFTHFILSFLVNAKNSQILATTHNREILNNKDLFQEDAIWFTDKSAGGATELYSLADFDTSVIRDTSNVYNAYKTGKLGAVPQLGDYYLDPAYADEKKDPR